MCDAAIITKTKKAKRKEGEEYAKIEELHMWKMLMRIGDAYATPLGWGGAWGNGPTTVRAATNTTGLAARSSGDVWRYVACSANPEAPATTQPCKQQCVSCGLLFARERFLRSPSCAEATERLD